jgi:hypothetical protein
MSKSLTLEDLNGLSEADLKDTILKYADALNTANSNVQVMVTSVQNKDAEILKLNEAVKVLHEANNKLTLSLSEAQAQVEQQDTGITFNEEEILYHFLNIKMRNNKIFCPITSVLIAVELFPHLVSLIVGNIQNQLNSSGKDNGRFFHVKEALHCCSDVVDIDTHIEIHGALPFQTIEALGQ